MTTIKKLTENEYHLIKDMNQAIRNVMVNGGKNSNIDFFFHDKDVTESDFDNVAYDIQGDELMEEIGRYDANGAIVAQDSDGVGFSVVEILHYMYDNVFGFTEHKGEKTFYLCETKTFWNEELKEDETHFFVDDEPVILGNCIRV